MLSWFPLRFVAYTGSILGDCRAVEIYTFIGYLYLEYELLDIKHFLLNVTCKLPNLFIQLTPNADIFYRLIHTLCALSRLEIMKNGITKNVNVFFIILLSFLRLNFQYHLIFILIISCTDSFLPHFIPFTIYLASYVQRVIPLNTPLFCSSDRHECQLCQKVFKQRVSLNEHLKSHYGITRCSLCGITAGTVAILRRHLRLVHRKTVEEVRRIVPTQPRHKYD